VKYPAVGNAVTITQQLTFSFIQSSLTNKIWVNVYLQIVLYKNSTCLLLKTNKL